MLKHQVKTLSRQTPQSRRRSIADNDRRLGCSTSGSLLTLDSSGYGGGCGKSPSSSSQSSDATDAFRCYGTAVRGRTTGDTVRATTATARSCSVSSLNSTDSNDLLTAFGALRHTDSPNSAVAFGRHETGCLKIYTDSIRPETDYKTVFGTTATRSCEVIAKLLSKFRIAYKDPRLFYLTMELHTRIEGGVDVETRLVLDEDSRPLELQNCHPNGKSRFRLHMTPGVAIRIYDYCVSPQSNYKSVLVSKTTTCSDAIGLILHSSRLDSPKENFSLVSVDTKTGHDYILPENSSLLTVYDYTNQYHQLHLRFARTRLLLAAPVKRQSNVMIVDDSIPAPSASLQRRLRFEDSAALASARRNMLISS